MKHKILRTIVAALIITVCIFALFCIEIPRVVTLDVEQTSIHQNQIESSKSEDPEEEEQAKQKLEQIKQELEQIKQELEQIKQ